MKYILYNNKIMPEQQVLLSPVDTGILRGDGVFTTLLVTDGFPVFLEEHCKRLYAQAEALNFEIIKICLKSIYQLIIRNQAQKGDYRLKICYIAREDFYQKKKLTLLLGIISPYTRIDHPLRLLPYPNPIETPLAHYKTLSYSHRFFLLEWAKIHQFDDVLTKDAKGHILESAFANIFWIKNKTLYYTAPDLPVFPGIVIEIIKNIVSSWEGYTIEKSYKHIEDIDFSSQWFMSNSLLGIKPVIQIGSVALIRNYLLEQRLYDALKKSMAVLCAK